MGRPLRIHQFHHSEIALLHVTQRCVRRAFLAGFDPVSNRDYSFRRESIRRRMEALASVFAIDVLTYAILSNHLHLILRSRPDVVASWSDRECAIRWLRVFPGRRLEEYLAEPTEAAIEGLLSQPGLIETIRQRLSDVSWFMRSLSQPIAIMANRQDDCRGHFWEGRFKVLRIVDEAALLACAMYVDLNPVRAALAQSLEESIHTSAYDRIQGESGQEIPSAAFDLRPVETADAGRAIRGTAIAELKAQRKVKSRNATGLRIRRDAWLAVLTVAKDRPSADPEVHQGGVRASDKGFLPLSWKAYLTLLQWTARRGRENCVEELPSDIAESLTRLGIAVSMWHDLVWNFKRYFGRASYAGSPARVRDCAMKFGKRWGRGQKRVQGCFVSA